MTSDDYTDEVRDEPERDDDAQLDWLRADGLTHAEIVEDRWRYWE